MKINGTKKRFKKYYKIRNYKHGLTKKKRKSLIVKCVGKLVKKGLL